MTKASRTLLMLKKLRRRFMRIVNHRIKWQNTLRKLLNISKGTLFLKMVIKKRGMIRLLFLPKI